MKFHNPVTGVKICSSVVDKGYGPFEMAKPMIEKQSKCENKDKEGSGTENSAPGLNNNLEFMGKHLHVQTERIGSPTPRIVTQVFSNGRVVFSKRSEIAEIESQEFTRVEELMRTQHLQTMREIQEKEKRILHSRAVSGHI